VARLIELPLTAEAEKWAKSEKARRDKSGLTDMFRKAGRDQRWTGLAAEYVLAEFLRAEGIPFKWNGGVDAKADFEIGGEGGLDVALKINNGPTPREDFEFIVSVQRLSQLADGALLGIVSVPQSKVWIVGYVSREVFARRATKHRKGDPGPYQDRPLAHPCYTIRADNLQPADLFFGLMEVTV
jgi:hypothetical protein